MRENSEIRQVPDNQEVYLDPHGTTSILFDILERVEKPDVEALHFHLEDIVDDDARVKVWGSGTVHLAKFPFVCNTLCMDLGFCC